MATKKQLQETIEELLQLVENMEEAGYYYNDGCGCCSSGSLNDDEDWKKLMDRVDELRQEGFPR